MSRCRCGWPAALLVAGLVGTALAGEVSRLGPLEIDTPWTRASIGTARPAAAYVTIRNTGEQPDRLIRVETPVTAQSEVHEMVHEGGAMKMRPAGPLEIPAGGVLRFAPGGELHIMLMALKEPLKEGASLPLTLVFESAGEITLEAPIAGMAADAPPP